METKEIQKLLDFIAHLPLDEVKIESADLKISVKRNGKQTVQNQVVASPMVNTLPIAVTPTAVVPASPIAKTDNLVAVKSPMIGTFYRSAKSDQAPFVEIGTDIKKGQTLCIIEAMKLFNEIESEISGKIAKVMVENANPVEFDQVLFWVEPS